MASVPDLLILLLAGAAGGFLSGLLGIGGGVLFIPILDMVLREYGISNDLVKYILANSLTVIIFTGLLNTYKQYKANNFYPLYIIHTAIPGILSVLFFSWLITQGEWYTKKLFNTIFILLLVPGIIRMFLKKETEEHLKENITNRKFQLVGFVTGIFTALSGLGGGIIMIPAFVNVLKLQMKKATSVSAGVVPFFALPTAIYYMTQTPAETIPQLFSIGFVVLPVVIPMIIGTLLTVAAGVTTGHRLPPKVVRSIFVVFVLLVVSKMLVDTLFF